MLSKADDYPIHQSPEPIAYVGDRNFYDRYFFNGMHASENIFFACAMGQYPNLNVIDAAFCVIVDGKQHSVFASRELGMERMETEVSPISVEILEPLVSHRITVAPNDSGIEADLTFRKRTIAVEEPRFTYRIGPRTIMDYTRLTQFGTWEGWIKVAGTRIEVTQDVFNGVRDRSWGIRPVGKPDPQPTAPPQQPQFYWLWAPLNFDDGCTLFHVNENIEGAAWARSAQWVPLSTLEDPGENQHCLDGRAALTFQSGTRHAKTANLTFTTTDGETQIKLTPRFKFFMRGVGYMHPERGHGTYHGKHSVFYETLDHSTINEGDFHSMHIQAIVDAEMEGALGSRKGRGLLEQLIIGSHEPSGFDDLIGVAP